MSEHDQAELCATTELAGELRRLRLDHGLSYRLLARRLGLSAHSGLADYENGRRIPPIDLITSYEKVFELPRGSLETVRARAFAERARRKATATPPPDDAVPVMPAPPGKRSVRRFWPVVVALSGLTVAVLTLAALDAGPPGRPPSTDAPASPGHSVIAGFHCPSSENASSETYTPTGGWGDEWHQSDGGWSGDGCDGKFVYVTTVHNPDDPDNWASDLDWRYHLVQGPATCLADVYVPASPRSGGPARYEVYGSITDDTKRIGEFTVNQAEQRGHWVAEGPWTTPDGQLRVTLTDIGDGRYNVAGAAVRATCTPTPAHR